ncbi:MAG: S4 domain-containing protein [Promicromonosporaceae bacterium]|nr:S4 domain-containing protein [Promicromonosporaceae bacterium]
MRIDVWLWAVRLFKTRSAAATLLRAGKVSLNDGVAKPATAVKVGDRITWRDDYRYREVVVEQLLPNRVGAALAAPAYTDFSPPIPTKAERTAELLAVGMRDRGSGRPTKRERREIDQLRGLRKG